MSCSYKISVMNRQFQTILQKAIEAFQIGKFDDADLVLREALQSDINSADAIFELGITYAKVNRFMEALAVFNCLQPYKNNDVRIPYNLGLIYSLQGKHQLALAAYDLALNIQPNDAEVLINKGSTYNDIKNYVLALEVLEKATKIKPDSPEAWSNKGIAFNNLNFCQESINAYNEAIKIAPNYYEAWSNKSLPLNKLKRFVEAAEACDKALSIKPDFAEAHYNKGVALNELKRYDEAIAQYDNALGIKSDINWASGDLLHTKMKICSWSGLTVSLDDIFKKVGASEKVTNPFSLLALSDDALLHKQCSEIYAQSRYPFNPFLGPIFKRPQSKKIRVGYFSADFKNHPVAFLIAELFEIHDRSQFEIYAFSLLKGADDMRDRLKLAFDHFIEVGNKSDIEIAKLSRSLDIDIAVDLTGITDSSRTGIFSYRAAPIQVNYLGYPGTVGADYIDYIVADKTLIPVESQSCYIEKVVYLPNSYQVNDRKRFISDRQFTKKELGLPENGFVFCCFNNNFKILPATFNGWMRILSAVEESVLWLLQDNSWVVENLKKEAQKRGVDAQRLVFADRVPLSDHLARHRQADLFLDTYPYNAHTTTSDALWAGLPVLTLKGQSFASRVAASLLNAIGLPELITSTQEEYEALAIDLALNPNKLTDIKSKLANNRLTAPLFDTPLFTKNLEAAYIKMMERYQADLQPDHMFIA